MPNTRRYQMPPDIADELRYYEYWNRADRTGQRLRAARESGLRKCRFCRQRYTAEDMATQNRCRFCPGRKSKHE